MKQSRVLNRPMFNRHNSAYGRGIASNLVTEEQRVRYNAGGRVGLAEGSWGWDKIKNMFGRGGVKGSGFTMNPPYTGGTSLATISKTPKFSEKALWEAAKKWGPKAGGAIASGLKRFPLVATGLAGAYVTDPEDWEEEMDISRWDKIKRDLTPWAGTKKKIEQYQEWKDKKKQEELDAKKKAEPDVDLEPVETTTLEVDEAFSPQEKKEKRDQVALAMAERLIGGSRDKWGSTAQMKNLSGALGDIRKITDPSDRREMMKKYEQWGKAYIDREKASYSDDMIIKKLVASGIGPTRAKEQVYFGRDITTIPRGESGKAIRKQWNEHPEKFKIVYDEEKDVYIIPSLGTEVTSIEDLITLRKQKKI